MWFLMSALRTQANTARSRRERTAHTATAPLTSTAARSHSTVIPTTTSFIRHIVLPYAMHTAQATSPAIAWHGEDVITQSPGKPGPDNCVQVSRHEGDYLYSVCSNHYLKGPGNRTTDENSDAQL